MQQLYTAQEVAKILRVKRGYVYELIDAGELRAIRLSERRIRIPFDALEEFIVRMSKGRQESSRRAAKNGTIASHPLITRGAARGKR